MAFDAAADDLPHEITEALTAPFVAPVDAEPSLFAKALLACHDARPGQPVRPRPPADPKAGIWMDTGYGREWWPLSRFGAPETRGEA